MYEKITNQNWVKDIFNLVLNYGPYGTYITVSEEPKTTSPIILLPILPPITDTLLNDINTNNRDTRSHTSCKIRNNVSPLILWNNYCYSWESKHIRLDHFLLSDKRSYIVQPWYCHTSGLCSGTFGYRTSAGIATNCGFIGAFFWKGYTLTIYHYNSNIFGEMVQTSYS